MEASPELLRVIKPSSHRKLKETDKKEENSNGSGSSTRCFASQVKPNQKKKAHHHTKLKRHWGERYSRTRGSNTKRGTDLINLVLSKKKN